MAAADDRADTVDTAAADDWADTADTVDTADTAALCFFLSRHKTKRCSSFGFEIVVCLQPAEK